MARIMIVHRYHIVRQGLCSLLQSARDLQVVGEATQPEQVLLLARETSPDVVLFDAGLSSDPPANSAVELVALLYRRGIRGIFVFAPSPGPVDEEQFFQFVKCGAAAYESPYITGKDLVEKVRRVSGGEYLMSSALLSPISVKPHRAFPDKAPEPTYPQEPIWEAPEKHTPSGADFHLSQRELDVLREAMQGRDNKHIAARLGISDQTVKNHFASIHHKTHLHDRTSMVVLALRLHLLSLEEYPCSCVPKSREAGARRQS